MYFVHSKLHNSGISDLLRLSTKAWVIRRSAYRNVMACCIWELRLDNLKSECVRNWEQHDEEQARVDIWLPASNLSLTAPEAGLLLRADEAVMLHLCCMCDLSCHLPTARDDLRGIEHPYLAILLVFFHDTCIAWWKSEIKMEVSSCCCVDAFCKGSSGLLVFNPNYIKWICTLLNLKINLK